MDPARTGSARTHVPASKPKTRPPKRDDLQIAKRPPRRGLRRTARDGAMGGRGGRTAGDHPEGSRFARPGHPCKRRTGRIARRDSTRWSAHSGRRTDRRPMQAAGHVNRRTSYDLPPKERNPVQHLPHKVRSRSTEEGQSDLPAEEPFVTTATPCAPHLSRGCRPSADRLRVDAGSDSLHVPSGLPGQGLSSPQKCPELRIGQETGSFSQSKTHLPPFKPDEPGTPRHDQ